MKHPMLFAPALVAGLAATPSLADHRPPPPIAPHVEVGVPPVYVEVGGVRVIVGAPPPPPVVVVPEPPRERVIIVREPAPRPSVVVVRPRHGYEIEREVIYVEDDSCDHPGKHKGHHKHKHKGKHRGHRDDDSDSDRGYWR